MPHLSKTVTTLGQEERIMYESQTRQKKANLKCVRLMKAESGKKKRHVGIGDWFTGSLCFSVDSLSLMVMRKCAQNRTLRFALSLLK